jgi:hypothetical protein
MIRQHAPGMKQRPDAPAITYRGVRIEAADMHHDGGLDEALVFQINSHVRNPFLASAAVRPVKEKQVAFSKILKVIIQRDFNSLKTLLGGVAAQLEAV